MEMAKLGENGSFQMFVADYRRAMKFYRNAVTGLGRTVRGEDERGDSDQYANVLLAPNYLNGKKILSDNYTGMQRLGFLSELEQLVESLAA